MYRDVKIILMNGRIFLMNGIKSNYKFLYDYPQRVLFCFYPSFRRSKSKAPAFLFVRQPTSPNLFKRA